MKMNKMLIFLALLFVLSIGVVSAVAVPTLTLVVGSITNVPGTNPQVTVKCFHGIGTAPYVRTTTLTASGNYAVVFPASKCAPGDMVQVKKDTRTKIGHVDAWNSLCPVYTAIVNIP